MRHTLHLSLKLYLLLGLLMRSDRPSLVAVSPKPQEPRPAKPTACASLLIRYSFVKDPWPLRRTGRSLLPGNPAWSASSDLEDRRSGGRLPAADGLSSAFAIGRQGLFASASSVLATAFAARRTAGTRDPITPSLPGPPRSWSEAVSGSGVPTGERLYRRLRSGCPEVFSPRALASRRRSDTLSSFVSTHGAECRTCSRVRIMACAPARARPPR